VPQNVALNGREATVPAATVNVGRPSHRGLDEKKQDQVDLEINNDDLSMILYYMILFFDR